MVLSPLRPLVTLLAVCSLTTAARHRSPFGKIKNLVTFGDSYTDTVVVGDGGVPWPIYAAGYGNFKLFPFARSGATCSNKLTPRIFPGVFDDEIPAYLNQTRNGRALKASETVYTLWIGTNDVGSGALLTSPLPGVTLVNTTECAVNWVSALYKTGARKFLFQNMIPLQLVPLYAPDSYPNRFWTQPRNTTEWSLFMTELTTSGNRMAELLLATLPKKLPGATIGLFNSHGLFQDMFDHPQLYLNGTAPLNVTGAAHACVFQEGEATSDPGVCTDATGTDRDSFLWFDELHPSEQADRIVAREIVKAINGSSTQWTTFFSR